MRNSNQNNGDQNTPPDRNADALAPPNLPGISITGAALSRGPFSAVYRGWDQVHRYDVIVKVLQTTGDPVAADRFRREAAIMAKLRHPNIVALYQFHDGSPSALVMEYVPGQTLDALIAAKGSLSTDRAALIIEEIAAALDCIHAENVVHRDVKPSNILLPKHGPARLTDFGVAHIDTSAPLTVHGDMLGTIEYASPEQVKGTSVPDARSDVYSLAAVAYFALTGTPPFPASDSSMQSQLSVMHQQVFSEPPPLRSRRADLSPGIDAAVRRGLAKDPAARYPSAGQLASALRSAVVAASGTPEMGAAATASRRTLALPGALVGAALLVGAGVFVWDHVRPAPPANFQPTLMSDSQPSPHAAVAVRPVPGVAVRPVPGPVSSTKPSRALPPKTTPKSSRVAALPTPAIPVMPAVPAAPAIRVAPTASPRVHAAPVPQTSASMQVAKRAVTERPKYRRHPALIASQLKPASLAAAKQHFVQRHIAQLHTAQLHTAPPLAWLSVYARQDTLADGQGAQTEAIPAQEVTVDGRPIAALAAGGWAAVPAGKHLVAFAPSGHTRFGRSPGLWVTLAPGAHVSRQVLLPIASPILAISPLPSRAALTASAATPAAPVQPIAPPTIAAPTALPQAAPALTAAAAPAAVGWYTVSGWIVRNPAAPKPTLVRTSAQWVKIDGAPNLALALGQWAELPAGKHTVTFQPTNGVGVGVKTWDIDLSPQGHLDQQIPLPPMIVAPN